MNKITGKLIRDVVMHWIYSEVWSSAKPLLLFVGHNPPR